jgi:hypothetical protein
VQDDPIALVLNDLLKLDDIFGCMVARQNMISVMPDQSLFDEVLFYIFPDTENALVAIIPALSNKGLIEVEMENTRREILKIMENQENERLATV